MSKQSGRINMHDAVIKVVGVGGCGGNAVEHMVTTGIAEVEYLVVNTDAQALRKSTAKALPIGTTVTKGLGAGANPAVGRDAALEDREAISKEIAGADMVFITAGMGGGTGTGAAPIVAEIARSQGSLTVGVVTKPFGFEGKRMKTADEGIKLLSQHVDSLIVIPNERLFTALGEDVTMAEAFQASNNVLRDAVSGISEVITCPGLVNVDFADVKTIMSERGIAMMSSGFADGENRAKEAARRAVESPLLEDVHLSGAKGVLVNITANLSLKMKEINEVMAEIRAHTAPDANVIFGTVIDENMKEGLRVTLIATGLGKSEPEMVSTTQEQQFSFVNAPVASTSGADAYAEYDTPAVMRSRRKINQDVNRLDGLTSGLKAPVTPPETSSLIPSFLRKQSS